MTLRDAVIQHMARDRYFRGSGDAEWDHPATEKVYERDAAATLDALLDFLERHTEEWTELADALVQDHLDQPNFEMGVAMEPSAFVDRIFDAAVATLRGTTEE